MKYTLEERQGAYKKLPEEVQDFIMSNDVTDITTSLLQEAGLSGDNEELADSQIRYGMLGLQTLDTTIDNIAEIIQKKPEDLKSLKEALHDKVFSKYPELGKVSEKEVTIQKVPEIHPTVTSEQSTPNIPTQSKEPGAPTPKINLSEIKPEKPEIAPTPKYTYPRGADPYREPVE